MSVRRLAPPEIQPKDFSFSKDNLVWAKKEITKYPEGRQQSAIIPLLWRAQEQHGGWLPEAAIRHVADFLGMAHIRALEVATFYTMFNLWPVGKFHVQLCGTTPCRLRGADDLEKLCRKRYRRPGRSDKRRQVLVGRGRMPWRLRQRANGADQLRLLRRSHRRELRQGSRRSRGRQERSSLVRKSIVNCRHPLAVQPRSRKRREPCWLTKTGSFEISTASTTGA